MLSPHNPHDSSAMISYEAPSEPEGYVLYYLSKEQYTNFEKRRRNGSQNPPTWISCSSYMTEDYFMCQQCSLRRIVHILTIEMQMQDLSVKHIDFVVVASTCGMQHSYDSDRER